MAMGGELGLGGWNVVRLPMTRSAALAARMEGYLRSDKPSYLFICSLSHEDTLQQWACIREKAMAHSSPWNSLIDSA